ncbi:hypothetical protein B7463_g3100, partial [Scytalidium lignicola]
MNLQSLLSSAPPHVPYDSNAAFPPLAPTPPLHAISDPNAMDHPPNPPNPFSDHEKRFVIAEAIKTSSIPLNVLMHMLDEWNFRPNWDEICLPPGRTPKSCRQVFENIRAQTQGYGTPGPSHKRRSIGDLSDPAIESSRKRLQTGGIDPSPRPLQPKPAPNGPPGQSTPIATTPVQRRRGRPTNAQLQARAYEAVQRGEMLPSGTTTNIVGPQSYGDVPGAGSFAIGLPMSMPGTGTLSTPPPAEGERARKKRGRPQGSVSKPKMNPPPEQQLTTWESLSEPAVVASLTGPAPEEKREEPETYHPILPQSESRPPPPPQQQLPQPPLPPPPPPTSAPVPEPVPVPAPAPQLPPSTGESNTPKSPAGPNILNPS